MKIDIPYYPLKKQIDNVSILKLDINSIYFRIDLEIALKYVYIFNYCEWGPSEYILRDVSYKKVYFKLKKSDWISFSIWLKEIRKILKKS